MWQRRESRREGGRGPESPTDFRRGRGVVISAYERALGALARRGRSVTEMERWLRDRDYAAEDVADAVERLVAAGLLDDEKFAAAFARSRILDRKLSRRRTEAELLRRGVRRSVADAAVAAVFSDEGVSEDAVIDAAVRKRLRAVAGRPAVDQERRLIAYLARRGFGGGAAKAAVRRVLQDEA
ncbi:MAG: recombination regulator RecX [Gemmatimonadetes bacterium]|nr:recombination regulator RecX [Gemmatimonadota bacterium]